MSDVIPLSKEALIKEKEEIEKRVQRMQENVHQLIGAIRMIETILLASEEAEQSKEQQKKEVGSGEETEGY